MDCTPLKQKPLNLSISADGKSMYSNGAPYGHILSKEVKKDATIYKIERISFNKYTKGTVVTLIIGNQ